MKLFDLTALVTGGAGGLGSAICRALAAEGAAVVVHYHRRESEAQALAAELRAAGHRAEACGADLTRELEARALVASTKAFGGGLDILVNNAGWTKVVPPQDLAGLSDEVIARTFALKVNAPLYLVRAAEPLLRASRNGSVVNITSVAGIAAKGSSLAYAAANAALSNLTRSLARVLAPEIRVNAVAPGYVDTGFAFPAGPSTSARVAQNNHLGRCATPEEIAATVRFLCADALTTTGEEIAVDGGIGRLGKR